MRPILSTWTSINCRCRRLILNTGSNCQNIFGGDEMLGMTFFWEMKCIEPLLLGDKDEDELAF